MATYYVSKSGNDANSGVSYALSKLTIQAAITTAGASTTTIIIGSGLYNEKLTITPAVGGYTYTFYCDGVVILDGTGLPANRAIDQYVSNNNITIAPYTSGGLFIVQNHAVDSSNLYLIYLSGGVINLTNSILIANGNYTGGFSSFTYNPAHTFTNVVFSGFTVAYANDYAGPTTIFKNCTFYGGLNGGTCAMQWSSYGLAPTITNCIFCNYITAYNVTSLPYSNDNIFYNITNWRVGATTYTSLPQLQSAGYDSRSVVSNPNFVDVANSNFYLKSQQALFPNVNQVGMYPYSYVRGASNNTDSTWQITSLPDNTGWYNPDSNVTKNGTTGFFELTSGSVGIIWSPVNDTGTMGTKTTRVSLMLNQSWPTNMIDTTITDVRPNYQTIEIRASDSLFSQNDGSLAWSEIRTEIILPIASTIVGRYVQTRLILRNNDVGA